MYNNPFHIFKELASGQIDAADKDAVKKLRKIYLSKVELAQSKTVLINEIKYTKNDLINLFENFANTEQLAHYKEIYENEELNFFLGKTKFYKNIKLEDYSDALLSVIRNDIVASFKYYAFKAYQNKQIEKVIEMLGSTIYQRPYLRNSLEPIIANICENHIEELEELADNSELKQFATSPEIRKTISKVWTQFYNLLSSNFDVYREDYALYALNLGSNLYNSGRKERAKTVYKAIKNIKCSDNNKRLVKNNYDIIVGGMGSGIFSNSYVIWIVVIFGIRLLLGFNTCNRSENYDYSPGLLENHQYEEVKELQKDYFDTSFIIKDNSQGK